MQQSLFSHSISQFSCTGVKSQEEEEAERKRQASFLITSQLSVSDTEMIYMCTCTTGLNTPQSCQIVCYVMTLPCDNRDIH